MVRDIVLQKRKKFYKTPKLRHIVRWTFSILFIMLFISSVCAGIGAYILYEKLYPLLSEAELLSVSIMRNINSETFVHIENTRVLDNKGELMMEINRNNVDYINYEDISPYLIDGYVAVEDKNFWVHDGIDYTSILRAAKELFVNKGEVTQGGSTITQQLLKVNVLGSLDFIETRWDRKFIEFFLAPTFEQTFSKEQIIEYYCNTNFYQNNNIGVEAAARYYFGKSASNLEAHEAAVLIGISNSPSKYNPIKNPEVCLEKRNRVLEQMYIMNVISDEEYRQSIAKPLSLNVTVYSNYHETYPVSLALHQTTLKLMELEEFEFKYVFPSEEEYEAYGQIYSEHYSRIARQIRQGGYTISTSIDLEVQNKIQEIVSNGISEFTDVDDQGNRKMQAATTVIDNNLGRIVAVVGGRGEGEFNRAYQAQRQPGSSIKPLLYATAINTGVYYPSKMIDDSRIEEDGAPMNADSRYKGAVSLREALARSTNTVAYRIIGDLGVDTFLEELQTLRFSGISWQDNGVKSLALGGFTYGVNTVDMSTAYYTLANGGKWNDTSCVTEVNYKQGLTEEIIFENKTPKQESVQAFEADSAYLTIDMMKGVLTEVFGTGRQMSLDKIPAAGKTGTTNSNKDEWFAGVTANYSMAVWVGADMPEPIPNVGAGRHAGAIWKESMIWLSGRTSEPYREFTIPNSIIECDINRSGLSVFHGNEVVSVGGTVIELSDTRPVADTYVVGQDLFSVRILETLSDNIDTVAQYTEELGEVTGSLASEFVRFRNMSVTDKASLDAFTKAYNELMQEAIAQNNTDAKVSIDRHYSSVMNSDIVKSVQAEYEAQQAAEDVEVEEILSEEELVKNERIGQAESALSFIENLNMGDVRFQQALFNAYSAVEACKDYAEYSTFRFRYDAVSRAYEGIKPERGASDEVEDEVNEEVSDIEEVSEEDVESDSDTGEEVR